MGENIVQLVNFIVSKMWVVIVIGVIHIVLVEHQAALAFIKSKKHSMAQLKPLMHRARYLLLGIALSLLAFSIVYTISGIFTSSNVLATISFQDTPPTGFWAMAHYQAQFAGLFIVAGLVAAGYCLILSAGSRWLVTLAKLLVTVSVLYWFFSLFAAYA